MSNLETHLRKQDEITEAWERDHAVIPVPAGGFACFSKNRDAINLTLSSEQVEYLLDAIDVAGAPDEHAEAIADSVTAALQAAVGREHKPVVEEYGQPDSPEPRPFSVSLAVTVRAYGGTTVMATSMAEALEIVRQHAAADRANAPMEENVWDHVSDVEWESQGEYTVCAIQDDEGDEPPIDDIELTDNDNGNIIDPDELRALVAQAHEGEPPAQWPAEVIEAAQHALPATFNSITIPAHGGGDPDGTNAARRNRGWAILDGYTSPYNGENLTDALGDLMHAAYDGDLDFAAILRIACDNFEAETARNDAR